MNGCAPLFVSARPIKIVIVNDEHDFLEMLAVFIRSSFKNVSLSVFENPVEAMNELLQSPPDLLIVDDKMPRLTGEELCRALLERQVKYPTIAASSWTPTEKWVKEFAGQGLNISFLSVPCDAEAILKAVETALNIRRDS